MHPSLTPNPHESDIDLTEFSPHHTLGANSNQAAKGNHTHPIPLLSNQGLQHGFSASSPVAFPTEYTANPDSVVIVPRSDPATSTDANKGVWVTSVSPTGFSYNPTDIPMYWMAVGPVPTVG